MKGWQLVLAALLYLWAAWDYAKTHQTEEATAWLCYACANIAFAWRALKPTVMRWL